MGKGLDNSSGSGKGKDNILEKNGGKDIMSADYKDNNDHQLACQDNNREDENNTQQENIKVEGNIDEGIRSKRRMSDTEEDKEQFCEETGKIENNTQQGNKGNDVIEEVKKIIDEKFDILNNKLESIEFKQEEKFKTQQEYENLKDQLQSKELELAATSSNLKNTKEQLQSKVAELNDVRNILQSKESELAVTSSNLEAKEKELNNTKEQLQSKVAELNDVRNILQSKESELATTSSNLEATKIRLNESENKLTTIENYLFKFKPLVRKMEKCSSLSKINSQINSESENERLLKFVGIFGNGEDFLRDLYKEFKDNKMNEKIALTTEELEFIDEINHYFRENILEEGQEEDVLITVDPSQDKFDKSIMQDILKASDFSFKTVEEFYVPGVKTKSYNMKAIVRGRK